MWEEKKLFTFAPQVTAGQEVPPLSRSGPKCQLPIGNPGAWLGSGVGWAFRSESSFSGGLGYYQQLLVNPWRQGRSYFLEARLH